MAFIFNVPCVWKGRGSGGGGDGSGGRGGGGGNQCAFEMLFSEDSI